MTQGDATWTLDDLTTEVEAALARDYGGAASGRVRDVPDRRTIRYYTTLGLIDRPAAMRGRTALYGPRHLLQLVAIKKLQAAGRSLSEIQAALTGQTDAELSRLAGLPAPEGPEPAEVPPARSDRAFWRQEPTAHRPASPDEDGAGIADESPRPKAVPPVLLGFPLHPDVTLLVATARPVDPDELDAIRAAATPLIDLLTRSRLIERREGGTDP